MNKFQKIKCNLNTFLKDTLQSTQSNILDAFKYLHKVPKKELIRKRKRPQKIPRPVNKRIKTKTKTISVEQILHEYNIDKRRRFILVSLQPLEIKDLFLDTIFQIKSDTEQMIRNTIDTYLASGY